MPSNLIQCVRICLNTPYMHHVRKMNVSKVWVCVCGWMDEKVGEWIGSGGGNVPPNKHTWSRWVSDWMQERGAVIPAVSRSPDSPPAGMQSVLNWGERWRREVRQVTEPPPNVFQHAQCSMETFQTRIHPIRHAGKQISTHTHVSNPANVWFLRH